MEINEEFDKQKIKVLKYIMYQKRAENEIRIKFADKIEENMLEDIIEYLKEAGYIDDIEFIKKSVDNMIHLKNLSIKEVKYKLLSKGIDKRNIEKYCEENYDRLKEYEINSAKKMWMKKQRVMEEFEFKQYLLKKGYRLENIEKQNEAT